MHSLIKGTIVAVGVAAATPAFAQWRGPGAIAGGVVAGAIIGGAIGSGYGYDYGYGYGPGYYGYGPGYYGYGPGYDGYGPAYQEPYPGPVYEGRSEAAAPSYSPGGGVAYCEQRFRSYNPATGTYLGYDGRRHPCP